MRFTAFFTNFSLWNFYQFGIMYFGGYNTHGNTDDNRNDICEDHEASLS